MVRTTFKVARTEKTGACFVEFPENIAEMEVREIPPAVHASATPEPAADRVRAAADVFSKHGT